MKTRQIAKDLYALGTVALIALNCCVFNVERTTQQKSGQATSVGLTTASIDMSGYSGNITVSGTSDSIVKATTTVSEMAIEGETGSAIEDLSISVARDGTTGSVAFSYPAGSDKWELLRVEDMTVASNKDLDVSAKTTSGNITLSGIDGFVTLETTSGNITSDVVAGCDISVTSGNVEVTLRPEASLGNATIKTTSGNIKVYVPKGFKADLELKVKSGNIHTPGDDHSHLNGGNAAVVISCTATSGNIRIEER
jgi:DUF4097 and DUF4098 domain-containing protein YvlB